VDNLHEEINHLVGLNFIRVIDSEMMNVSLTHYAEQIVTSVFHLHNLCTKKRFKR